MWLKISGPGRHWKAVATAETMEKAYRLLGELADCYPARNVDGTALEEGRRP